MFSEIILWGGLCSVKAERIIYPEIDQCQANGSLLGEFMSGILHVVYNYIPLF